MCGIAGVFDSRLAGAAARLEQIASAMAVPIARRGPDAQGIWVDADAGVAFVHRRLSVIDLTPTGAQPMLSSDGRWAITYNGELYNTEELRARLTARGVRCRGQSDTEVLLETIALFGVEEAILSANGMFALALFDARERALHLVRDRVGIKPLYWCAAGGRIAFASELSAVRAAIETPMSVDPVAASTMMNIGFVLGTCSILQGVHRVAPGSIVTLRTGQSPVSRTYWSARAAAEAGIAARLSITDDAAADELNAILLDAVPRQMVSDVPIGAFLSGGIDSTCVAALMQARSGRPIRTFTIGFDDAELDEARHAAAVARHLGTDHTELMATERDALAIVPRLSEIYDEPFADSSQIPTVIVSELTRKHVTVALSGDGGDEVFAGYNRHRFAAGIGQWAGALPAPLRMMMSGLLTGVAGSPLPAIVGSVSRTPSQFADKLRKLARTFRHDELDAYSHLLSQNEEVPSGGELQNAFAIEGPLAESGRALERMQYRDVIGYLPDDILTKVDRASMSVALEVRVPLLDHRLIEFGWRLPNDMRVRNGTTKWLLRKVLDRYVPADLVDRPKQGFAVPLAKWLRGPLRDWAEALLAPADFGGGFVDRAAARELWKRVVEDRSGAATALWPVLMFEAWRQRHA